MKKLFLFLSLALCLSAQASELSSSAKSSHERICNLHLNHYHKYYNVISDMNIEMASKFAIRYNGHCSDVPGFQKLPELPSITMVIPGPSYPFK